MGLISVIPNIKAAIIGLVFELVRVYTVQSLYLIYVEKDTVSILYKTKLLVSVVYHSNFVIQNVIIPDNNNSGLL